MQSVEKMDILNAKYPQLKNVINNESPTLKKVQHLESHHSDSNYTLLKRFLKELQFNNNNFLRSYNREVI